MLSDGHFYWLQFYAAMLSPVWTPSARALPAGYKILDTAKGSLANRAADDVLTQPHLTLRPKIPPD